MWFSEKFILTFSSMLKLNFSNWIWLSNFHINDSSNLSDLTHWLNKFYSDNLDKSPSSIFNESFTVLLGNGVFNHFQLISPLTYKPQAPGPNSPCGGKRVTIKSIVVKFYSLQTFILNYWTCVWTNISKNLAQKPRRSDEKYAKDQKWVYVL